MKPAEVREHLQALGLSATELAQLMGVGLRTVRRWTDPDPVAEDIPGPAARALAAWRQLDALGVHWRSDGVAVVLPAAPGAPALDTRTQRLAVRQVVQAVEARGGPRAPWDVDLARHRARLGPLLLTYVPLAAGGFMPQTYVREDSGAADGAGQGADLVRDWPLIEDALACIARRLALEGHAPLPASIE